MVILRPNRDGTISNKGCIFVRQLVVVTLLVIPRFASKQFNEVKTIIHHKWPNASYIVLSSKHKHLCSFRKIEKIYEEAISLDQNIVAISIATRPIV